MSDSDDGDAGVVVGEIPPTMVRKHIKKRALRNKSLSVSFDEKNLQDFVTGFHKRKKKRRKEAQRQLQEKARLKRIEARKQRKLERDVALHDRNINEDTELNDVRRDGEEEGADTSVSVFETKTYQTGDTTIRVTTSEFSRDDDDDFGLEKQIPKLSSNIQMKPLPMKKQQLKRTSGRQPHKAGNGVFRKKEKRKSKV